MNMKKYISIIITCLAAIIIFDSCKKQDPTSSGSTTNPPSSGGGGNNPPAPIAPPPAFGFYVVGYFPSYKVVADVPDVKFRMCNVVNYAFARINSSGGLAVEVPSKLIDLRNKAKAQGAKVFISISGLEADFKAMATTAAGRTAFIQLCMNIVRQYNLDGIDMDWEFPRTSDGTNVMFTDLMKQLSDSCHTNSKYYLTAAITAGKYAGAVRDAISTELLTGNYVDWFNIMSYDDFNTSPTVLYQHHTPLSLSTTSFDYWVTQRGMPANKAVLGIAGYGRPSGITQVGNIVTFDQIIAQGGNPQLDSAIVSTTATQNFKVYYNGLATVKRKAMLAKQRGNGIMLWEKAQDAHDNNSLLKAVCDTIGRTY
jgi:chitinase